MYFYRRYSHEVLFLLLSEVTTDSAGTAKPDGSRRQGFDFAFVICLFSW